MLVVLRIRLPRRSTRTDTLFPCTTLFRSPAAVLKTMREAGYAGDAKALPSIFLGAVDASPLQMAEMYGTLASGGFHAEPSAIREVQTKEGKPLPRYPLQINQVFSDGRSEERRVGKECVSKCKSRG